MSTTSFIALNQSCYLSGIFPPCIEHGFLTKNSTSAEFIVRDKPIQQQVISAIREQFISDRSFPYSVEKMPFYLANQVHGDNTLIVDGVSSPLEVRQNSADALVTNLPNTVLAVKTADCAPILLLEPEKRIIAATHAGWRGAVCGIIESTIDAMVSLGGDRNKIVAAIGPCIQQSSYEIDDQMRDNFAENEKNDKDLFFPSSQKQGYYFFNLPEYCRRKLLICKVKQVDNSGIDTYSNPENLCSYRYLSEKKETEKALLCRQASWIMLR